MEGKVVTVNTQTGAVRHFRPDDYAEMVFATKLAETANVATIQRLQEKGISMSRSSARTRGISVPRSSAASSTPGRAKPRSACSRTSAISPKAARRFTRDARNATSPSSRRWRHRKRSTMPSSSRTSKSCSTRRRPRPKRRIRPRRRPRRSRRHPPKNARWPSGPRRKMHVVAYVRSTRAQKKPNAGLRSSRSSCNARSTHWRRTSEGPAKDQRWTSDGPAMDRGRRTQ